ncbi:hypothetical protein TrRE_jg5483 [Triparma retinervis]|uniref:Ubiquitin-like domain-containing protein n=1 Tax=Triparma retinervis TaxID=2557542 RepID=A0A9W6ZAY2_9STRA|nr:hypothetical protein TrRE_jg5483 [Triparma retinervis]
MSAGVAQMHVRVKRKGQTYFVPVERPTKFKTIKDKISDACGMNEITATPLVPPENIMLVMRDPETGATKDELKDEGAISDLQIANDAIIYARFKKASGGDFEELDLGEEKAE